jgi:deoxyribose-phosphate aldolase
MEFFMTKQQLAQVIDHTLLRSDATQADLEMQAELAVAYGVYGFCVHPTDVRFVRRFMENADAPVRVIGVVGFPLGCNRAEVKAFEAQMALDDGAEELDMVMHVGALKSGDHAAVSEDIEAVTSMAERVPVKVILETCLLSDDEKLLACRLACDAGAAFVKTSTGLARGGATLADVRLMRGAVGDKVGVKAAGGIRSPQQAIEMIRAGANRIGCSATADILDACR